MLSYAAAWWNAPWFWALIVFLVAALAVLVALPETRRAVVTGLVGVRYAAVGLGQLVRGRRGIGPPLLRHAFEDLGPTYIKLGQIIASSAGLFPATYVREFQKCLDRVRPFPYDEALRIVEAELGVPLGEVFARFDATPLASASIAQVHTARLHDGREVVVKIQRPAIRARIDADIGILRLGARVLDRLPAAELANPVALIEDFDTTIHEELDFVREAANMREFNRIMAELGHRDIAAPIVVDQCTTTRVLTMERFYGVRIDDVEAIRQRPVDAEARLVEGLRAWFQCMVIYGFFHGDVHAGNLLLLDDGRLGFLDFGIIGRFGEPERRRVTDYIVAFVSADYVRLGQVMLAMGSVRARVDFEALAEDLRHAYAPILERTFGELNYGELLPGILKVAVRHRMRLPNEFVLVTKQLLFFDRYAKLLAPNLNIFTDPRLMQGLAEDVARARARDAAMEGPAS